MTARRKARVTRNVAAIAIALTMASGPHAGASSPNPEHKLTGRAVLPVETYAPGPPAGSFFGETTINGIQFPLPAQPVQGFSAVVTGRSPGEYLAMPDNGFGGKANSRDFLIRAYYIKPDFKTRHGGTGAIEVGEYIEFRDPNGLIGFPVVNETGSRLLTGGDIDPESLQRAPNGDYWVGDEFGPWILHFGADGVLLDPPFPLPGGLMSPNNPFLAGQSATHPNSRGIEAMAITPDGERLYAALEGPTVADTDKSRRYVFEFATGEKAFTGRVWEYRTEQPGHMVADVWALDQHRMVLIERDGGLGVTALFRNVYLVDLRRVAPAGNLQKQLVVDLTKIPDPDHVSLPEIHAGDLGLGDPFWVMCESVEVIHAIDAERLLVGCDNNFPNKGRNPGLADDNEFIVAKVPALKSLG